MNDANGNNEMNKKNEIPDTPTPEFDPHKTPAGIVLMFAPNGAAASPEEIHFLLTTLAHTFAAFGFSCQNVAVGSLATVQARCLDIPVDTASPAAWDEACKNSKTHPNTPPRAIRAAQANARGASEIAASKISVEDVLKGIRLAN